MKAFKIEIFGKVQGVFYRASTIDKAKELKLAGTVKNMPDGSVQIFAQGEQKDLEELVKWCYNGPRLAEVKKVTVTETEALSFDDFISIR